MGQVMKLPALNIPEQELKMILGAQHRDKGAD
jgi:hypothetical protein